MDVLPLTVRLPKKSPRLRRRRELNTPVTLLGHRFAYLGKSDEREFALGRAQCSRGAERSSFREPASPHDNFTRSTGPDSRGRFVSFLLEAAHDPKAPWRIEWQRVHRRWVQ